MTNSVTSTTDMMTGSVTTLSESRNLMYVFEVNLEIKEDDGKVKLNSFHLNMNYYTFQL